MKRNNYFSVLFAAICFALIVTSCSNSNQKSVENNSAVKSVSPEKMVKRGEYLVTVMGCNDCLSPKKMGINGPEVISELMLSGFQSTNPIIKGKFKGPDGTRLLLPPIPWQGFAALKDEDVSAVFACCKCIKPVVNVVPQTVPPDQM